MSSRVVLSIYAHNLKILNGDLLVTHLSGHLLALEHLARIRCSAVGTCVTVELGTMSHGSSVLSVSLDRALEAFTLGDCCGVYLIANLKDVSLDLLRRSVLAGVLKSELLYVSLSRNTGLCEMSLLSLVSGRGGERSLSCRFYPC